jgi:divalent metal cation (Fe/Co/Zn/Cd) transporter
LSERARSLVALVVGAIVAVSALGGSIFFFLESVGLMARDTPYVTASILSAIIGIALLSAATTVTRVLLLARVAEKVKPEDLLAAAGRSRRETGSGKEGK